MPMQRNFRIYSSAEKQGGYLQLERNGQHFYFELAEGDSAEALLEPSVFKVTVEDASELRDALASLLDDDPF